MTKFIFQLLGSLVEEQIERNLKRAISPLAPYLKMLFGGVVLMIVGGFAAGHSLLFFSAALFFAVADLPYVAPALWVGVITFVIAFLCLGLGISRLRRPRLS